MDSTRSFPLPLDRPALVTLVDAFYDEVRYDALLGPVFADAIADGAWDHHKQRMVSFWSTAMLGAREFRGNVFGKHQAMPQLTPEHFARWLALFSARAHALFAHDDAEALLDAARGMARGLQIGLFGRAA
ncbi:group III truncated hemoglobin [Massilia sp. HP4]|uniref:group III truncated hemoglobin n=1 Tax=Massilia sp. HP4 TaxID=2562316 RepID=UPI0010C04CB1|nr:group III truncated hemoglobin [Massilia sp. HP4]